MTIPTLRPIPPADRGIITALFQPYLHDIAATSHWPIGTDGLYAYPADLLPPYWDAPETHFPYIIYVADEIAGFCLVRKDPSDGKLWDMGQFFVLRKFRRAGIGYTAFQAATHRHPGQWQVRVLDSNAPAYAFWRNSITQLTGQPPQQAKRIYQKHPMTCLTFETPHV